MVSVSPAVVVFGHGTTSYFVHRFWMSKEVSTDKAT